MYISGNLGQPGEHTFVRKTLKPLPLYNVIILQSEVSARKYCVQAYNSDISNKISLDRSISHSSMVKHIKTFLRPSTYRV